MMWISTMGDKHDVLIGWGQFTTAVVEWPPPPPVELYRLLISTKYIAIMDEDDGFNTDIMELMESVYHGSYAENTPTL